VAGDGGAGIGSATALVANAATGAGSTIGRAEALKVCRNGRAAESAMPHARFPPLLVTSSERASPLRASGALERDPAQTSEANNVNQTRTTSLQRLILAIFPLLRASRGRSPRSICSDLSTQHPVIQSRSHLITPASDCIAILHLACAGILQIGGCF